jgi:hypothetical protein
MSQEKRPKKRLKSPHKRQKKDAEKKPLLLFDKLPKEAK